MPLPPSKGILFITLGSPKNPSTSGVRSYLKSFLSDSRVLSIPPILRFFLLHGIILPFRAPKVSRHYHKIWTQSGSPQTQNSLNFFEAINKELSKDFQCQLAFQYGVPSIQDALHHFSEKNIEDLFVVPLFPQYTSAVTGSIIEDVLRTIQKGSIASKIKFIDKFFDQDFYIKSLARQLKKALSSTILYDCVIFSYHGVPITQSKSIKLKDAKIAQIDDNNSKKTEYDYIKQCRQTTKHVIGHLGKIDQKIITSFQSRYGKGEWVRPYSRDILAQLAKERKKVLVICPSFTFDCLETLYEIDIEEKEKFLNQGGGILDRLPCLNNDPMWIKGFSEYIRNTLN